LPRPSGRGKKERNIPPALAQNKTDYALHKSSNSLYLVNKKPTGTDQQFIWKQFWQKPKINQPNNPRPEGRGKKNNQKMRVCLRSKNK
jgi:hypothetical protein